MPLLCSMCSLCRYIDLCRPLLEVGLRRPSLVRTCSLAGNLTHAYPPSARNGHAPSGCDHLQQGGEQVWPRYLVRGDQLFCHGQSRGIAYWDCPRPAWQTLRKCCMMTLSIEPLHSQVGISTTGKTFPLAYLEFNAASKCILRH